MPGINYAGDFGFDQSEGSIAMSGERKIEEERAKVNVNNGQVNAWTKRF